MLRFSETRLATYGIKKSIVAFAMLMAVQPNMECDPLPVRSIKNDVSWHRREDHDDQSSLFELKVELV